MKRRYWAGAIVAAPVAALMQVAAAGAETRPAPKGAIDCYLISTGDCSRTLSRPLPVSVPEFERVANAIGTSKKGGAVLFLLALQVGLDEPRLSERFFGERLAGRYARDNRLTQVGRQALQGLLDNGNCVRGLVHGSRPDAPRAYDSQSVSFTLHDPVPSGDRIGVCSRTLSQCVTIRLVKGRDGHWRVNDFSALFRACR